MACCISLSLTLLKSVFFGKNTLNIQLVCSFVHLSYEAYGGAYILEASTGVIFILPFLRSYRKKPFLKKIKKTDLLRMIGLTSITFIGTVSLAFALQIDGFGLTSLLTNVGVPISIIMHGLFFMKRYQESSV